jgi:citrate synthase
MAATEWLQAALVQAATRDLRAVDQTAEGIQAAGVRIIGVMAGALGARATSGAGEGIATALARGWKSDPRTLNAALILCADHELNPSSFTARVVAGTQATPYAAVIAALSALSGARHGGHTARVSALLREVGEPGRAARVISARLRRGEDLPGFGHVLYPEGDPRAAALLNMATERFRHAPALLLAQAVAAEGLALTGKRPNIDFALVTLALAGDLPEDAALGLFALGRTAGWIAHIIEQVSSGLMIRPRAHYTGK